MARINDAWHILSDASRRARWDREHALPVQPPHWAASPDVAVRSRPEVSPAPSSPMDSPWAVMGVVGGIAAAVAAAMVGMALVSAPRPDPLTTFTSPVLELRHPENWTRARGSADQESAHRIVLHVVTYPMPSKDLCTDFGEPCHPSPGEIPPGEASIVVIAYEGGTPPEPEPLVSRPFGLDADAMIGGRPAAVEREAAPGGNTLVWYQLSPPGFPGRWIEVNTIVAVPDLEDSETFGEIEAMLETLEFREVDS